jgi:hypothetical protein
MLSCPHRAAGPPGARFARTIVGSIEPQPDSTITTPRISPFDLGTTTWKKQNKILLKMPKNGFGLMHTRAGNFLFEIKNEMKVTYA